MPKLVKTPKTLSQIVADSDARRGMKAKSYKLPIELIDKIATLSATHGITQGELIAQAVALWEHSPTPTPHPPSAMS